MIKGSFLPLQRLSKYLRIILVTVLTLFCIIVFKNTDNRFLIIKNDNYVCFFVYC